MYQPWVFAATLAAGSGLFAYAAVQRDLPTPPDIAPAPQAVRVLPPPAPAPIAEPETSFVEIEPIVIEARHRTARAAAPPPEPKVVDKPCSDWRELGPTRVSQNKPTGSVSVRELCP